MKAYLKIFSLNLLLVALTSGFTAKAQLTNIQGAFTKYQQKNLQEKLYVHTDKSFYLTGEILWLKVYDVNAATNKPLSFSKVVYVDILDKSQTSVIQAKIALNNGSGNGSIYIPVNLNNGNYKLRAYTALMKNYSPEFYFEKQISIVNPLRSSDLQAAEKNTDPDIQFFPEGGNLINGFSNKVGFKITNTDGKGMSLIGALINQRNDTLAHFKSLMFGMGSFVFTPSANDTYKAVFKINGKVITKPLPQAATQGYGLLLDNNGANQLTIKVNSGRPSETLYLVAHNTQNINIAQSANLNNGTVTFTIDKSLLTAGITHFTIFNTNNQPVAERLFFTKPLQKLVINATSDNTYSIRKKASVSFNTSVANGKAAAADLSMSVYRVDSLKKTDYADIQSYLWLTSELKGSIESAGYYFNNSGATADEALDNLMLTQGWRRFDWKNVFTNTNAAIKFLPEYNGHLINGKITDASGAPAPGIIAYLGIPGKRVQMYPALSDSTGHLTFNTRDMYGPGEIVVQTNTTKDSTYHIDIQSPFSEQYSSTTVPVLKPNSLPQALLESYSLSMQVQNLYASAKVKQFYEPGIDSSAFYFNMYKSYKLDDYTRFTTMEEVLREYVLKSKLSNSKGHFQLRTYGENGAFAEDPLMLIDGIPIFNTDKVIAADPLKVRKLETVNLRYFYGPTVYDGIFSFTTYKGDLGGVELDPRAVILDYEGMQLQRKFYSPVYDSETQMKSRLPDFRNVLYWLPEANTGADGKNRATFYTSDQPGKYIAVIEGITRNGEAGSGYVVFEVKK